ncbi:unnamed protein product [Fusarium equiseti]|uniref:Uncharacterized protein n=1 Tax=Fusarium equiseti TaxID=61235 RepID=A0A8J2IJV9_FUSEQ|nr:unnamed protein product [Fusarium equiseti]
MASSNNTGNHSIYLSTRPQHLTSNQAELQNCVYQELMVAVKEAAELLPDTFDDWPAEAEEINARMEEKLKDFDKLAGGFKKFVENAREATKSQR